MSMPLQQKIAVAKYVAGKKLKGEKKYASRRSKSAAHR
jgi:hypothetical protein